MSTCQICAREIKLVHAYGHGVNKVIAHHGYRRPGAGWQTASCPGARHRPYEEACDVLPEVIEMLGKRLHQAGSELEQMTISPPPGLLAGTKGWEQRFTVLRPSYFDPATVRPDYRRNSYVSLWLGRKHELESEIKMLGKTVEGLRQRLADWRPPSPPKGGVSRKPLG